MTDQPGSGPTDERTSGTPTKRPDWWTWGIGAGLLVLCLLCGWGIHRSGSSDATDLGVDAERVCQDFVKQRLKAPATAKFSGLDHSADGADYTVTGAVDSQNSFGAMLRSGFTCVVRDTSGHWELQSVTGLS